MSTPPLVVKARGADQQAIRLALGEEVWRNAVLGGDLAKIGQYYGLVQTGAEWLKKASGLLTAHSLWEGLQRPVNDHVDGPNHFAYILSPNKTCTWSPRLGQVMEEPAPQGSVFMVSVWMPPSEQNQDLLHRLRASCGDQRVVGEIQDWEWFTSDPDRRGNPQPYRPDRRFKTQHW